MKKTIKLVRQKDGSYQTEQVVSPKKTSLQKSVKVKKDEK